MCSNPYTVYTWYLLNTEKSGNQNVKADFFLPFKKSKIKSFQTHNSTL